jgi:hypothetical protein
VGPRAGLERSVLKRSCTSAQIHCSLVRFQVLTSPSMKMAVFWVVAPCSLVEIDRRFRGTSKSTNQHLDKRIARQVVNRQAADF